MKKIISFSLYGNKPNFQVGAVVNVLEAKRLYPDWKCRFYTTDDEGICKQLEYLGAEIVRMDDWPDGEMFWRFLAVDDADVCLSRDTDSVVNEREVGAVNEWLESDYQWHAMHDHKHHRRVSILGGMWGFRHYGDIIPEALAQRQDYIFDFRRKPMRQHIDEWVESEGTTVARNSEECIYTAYGRDQMFLGYLYENKAQTNIMWHGSWVNNSGNPFPTHVPCRYGNFVGDYSFWGGGWKGQVGGDDRVHDFYIKHSPMLNNRNVTLSKGDRVIVDGKLRLMCASPIEKDDKDFDNGSLRETCLESSRKLQGYDGPRRLVDRIILSWDGNPVYKDFWENLSPIYKDVFNIHPTLFFIGSEERMKECNLVEGATDRHDIFRLKDVPEVDRSMFDDGQYWCRAGFPRNWSITWSIFYGASLFPEDVCVTSGIDSLLLGDRFFDFIREDMQPKEDDWVKDKLVIPLGDAYNGMGHYAGTYPTSHVTAKGKIFKQLCGIEDCWEEEIKKVFWSKDLINFTRDQVWHGFGRDYWGLDEQYWSVFVRNDKIFGCQPQGRRPKSDLTIIKEGFFSYWITRRLCRGRNTGAGKRGKGYAYGTKKCQDGYYIEIHGDRPFHASPFFENVITDFMYSPHLDRFFKRNRLYI